MLLIRLEIDLRDGVVRILDPQAGERLARAMADLMEKDPSGKVRWVAARFLADNAHPAAADALVRVASKRASPAHSLDRSDTLAAGYAQTALMALGDKRLIPILLESAREPRRPGSWDVFRKLALLGHAAGRDSLEAFIEDPRVESDYEAVMGADPRVRVRSPEELKRRAQSEAQKDRNSAQRAIRDIDLLLSAGLKCPFPLDDHAIAMIKKNGFVILPDAENEMFLHYGATYPFVTADAVFHTFMILVKSTLDEMEQLVVRDRLREFSEAMSKASLRQTKTLRVDALDQAARKNAAFFSVAAVLLSDPPNQSNALQDLPRDLQDSVAREVEQIRAHDGIHRSALFGVDEDFTKYTPRGRHGSSPVAAAYFQAVVYFGRTMFRLKSDEETYQALLLCDLLAKDGDLMARWNAIDSLFGTLFGERDDLAFPDYVAAARALRQSGGGEPTPDFVAIARDAALLADFRSQALSQPPPRINTAYIPLPQEGHWRDDTRGLRVFGQRYSRPNHLFQTIMEDGTWPPSGLDVAAELLGSRRAASLRTRSAATLSKLAGIASESHEDPYSSLMEGYIYSARTLFESDPRLPSYMAQAPWEERLINTALGGWAEVQHSVAPYAKDANTYMSASAMVDRVHGYVEPSPMFFDRLDTLTQRLLEISERSQLFERIAADQAADSIREKSTPSTPALRPDDSPSHEDYKAQEEARRRRMRVDRGMFDEFSTVLRTLSTIAEKELRGEGQSIDDGLFLKGFKHKLARFAFHRTSSVAPQSMAVITDPATEYQSGECLEVGVGRPRAIYIKVPDGDRQLVCRGAVYTYTEFVQPIANRLDDTQWKAMSLSNDNDGHPPWIATRPDLGLVRRLTRAELEALKSDREWSGVDVSGGREPWNPVAPQSVAARYVGGSVDRGDLDVLIAVADQDTVNTTTLAFVLREMAQFSDDPGVLACYGRQVDRVASHAAHYWRNDDHVRLHNTIVGLGCCGKPALAVLNETVTLVSVSLASPGHSPQREHYQETIRAARESIAGRSPRVRPR